MPVIDDPAAATISAFVGVPQFAYGHVRDIRVRWAFAEIGRDYRTELLDATTEREIAYRRWQPFGQVPAFADGDLRLFESGAILLYLGEQDARLLPTAPDERWRVISWSFAALNSIEPITNQIVSFGRFHADKDWAAGAHAAAAALMKQRLASLAGGLKDDAGVEREWLAGPFSIADILMVTVLRNLDDTDLLRDTPTLAAYKARGEARAAFRQALSEQLADFGATTEDITAT